MNPRHKQPNVVLVVTDDQGYGDLACHGNPIIRTPNLDKMYGESVCLSNYHVGPTCAPTRAGLLTGHYANSAGVWHTIGGRSLLRRDEISMADFFARSGYVTGIFGKWHLGDNYPYRPQDRGFQEVVTHGGGGVGNTPDYWGNKYFDDTYWTHNGYRSFDGYCTDVWFREALKFIDRHKDEPFFCYIPTNAPHTPHLVERNFSDPYLPLTPHEERAKFYGMVTNIDENFGHLRLKLEEMGLAENTILIFMTDNGSAGGVDTDRQHFVLNGYNCGMRGKKGSEYDGGHRVPLFIHWSAGGLTQGQEITRITANVDLLPTLLELCNLDDPTKYDFDGRSLVPLIRDPKADWADRALVTDSQRVVYPIKWRRSSVMTDRWRLVNGQELYDIHVDPEQRSDISAQHPSVVERLRQEYEHWWNRVSRQFDEEIPITIGSSESVSVQVNAHDWRNEGCDCVWNQNQVRAGLIYNGYWELDVASPGIYEFELRRWPKEEDRAIADGIPGEPVPIDKMTITSGYGGGRALAIRHARIRVGDQEADSPVTERERKASFVFELEPGLTHLQTYLYNQAGDVLGAYYVYITKLS